MKKSPKSPGIWMELRRAGHTQAASAERAAPCSPVPVTDVRFHILNGLLFAF